MKRWLNRKSLIAVVALYVVLSVMGGALLVEVSLHPPTVRPVNEAAEKRVADLVRPLGGTVETVSREASDGTELSGWLLSPSRERANGNAVLLLHGVSDSRVGVLGFVPFLLDRGYTLLLPDARAHGKSGGLATYGLLERNDVREWAHWLKARTAANGRAAASCVYAFGASMGAAMALQSLDGGTRDFCALVVDSPFAEFKEVAFDRVGQQLGTGPWLGRTLLRPMVEVAFLYGHWKYGLQFSNVSPARALHSSAVPVFLIHGEEDYNIPIRHAHALTKARPGISFWSVPGASHTAAHGAHQAEYERRVLAWFAQHSASPQLITTN